jgi:hypothetical protein
MALAVPNEPKPFPPDDSTRMDDDAIAHKNAIVQDRKGMDATVHPDDHIPTDVSVRENDRAVADDTSFANDGEIADEHPFAQLNAIGDARFGADESGKSGGREKALQKQRHRQTGIVNEQTRLLRPLKSWAGDDGGRRAGKGLFGESFRPSEDQIAFPRLLHFADARDERLSIADDFSADPLRQKA